MLTILNSCIREISGLLKLKHLFSVDFNPYENGILLTIYILASTERRKLIVDQVCLV